MNKYEKSLDRIKKRVEIGGNWTDEDIEHYKTIVEALKIAAEVDEISEKIIRKKVEVSEYWQNDVKQYRALKGYSDIEHDADNFLRGYNEAVEDMLAILDGKPQ